MEPVQSWNTNPALPKLSAQFAELDICIGSLRNFTNWRVIDFYTLEITQDGDVVQRLGISDLLRWSALFDELRLQADRARSGIPQT